jgi:hypothetical protein
MAKLNPYNRGSVLPIAMLKESNEKPLKPRVDFLRAPYIALLRNVTKYSMHTVTEKDAYALDAISFKYYDTHDLWWVIGFYNGIIHPLRDVTPGTVLKIPEYRELTTLFQSLYQNRDQIGTLVKV